MMKIQKLQSIMLLIVLLIAVCLLIIEPDVVITASMAFVLFLLFKNVLTGGKK